AAASIVRIKSFERDSDEGSWTEDLINYTFRTKDGFVFAGVNEANTSETTNIIGTPDESDRYPDAHVTYIRTNPSLHRLNGWGYGGFGPPGSVLNIIIRMAIS